MRTLPEVCLPGRKEWEGSVSYCYKSDPREWVEVVQEEGPGLLAQRRVQQGLWSLWGTAAHQRSPQCFSTVLSRSLPSWDAPLGRLVFANSMVDFSRNRGLISSCFCRTQRKLGSLVHVRQPGEQRGMTPSI